MQHARFYCREQIYTKDLLIHAFKLKCIMVKHIRNASVSSADASPGTQPACLSAFGASRRRGKDGKKGTGRHSHSLWYERMRKACPRQGDVLQSLWWAAQGPLAAPGAGLPR